MMKIVTRAQVQEEMIIPCDLSCDYYVREVVGNEVVFHPVLKRAYRHQSQPILQLNIRRQSQNEGSFFFAYCIYNVYTSCYNIFKDKERGDNIMNAEKMDFAKLENVTSAEFVELIKEKVKNGAELLSVRPGEYYVYVDLFDHCFHHYIFDLSTKDYRANYLSFEDIRIYMTFMEKEGVAQWLKNK